MLILNAQISFGIDCNKISKDEDYENSDIVFFGRVIEVYDTSYRIRVLEIFKGNIADTLIGTTRDSIVPKIGSHWLIYGMTYDSKIFGVLPCGGSKCQEWPLGLTDVSFPLPPPKILQDSKPLVELYSQIQFDKSLNEFYFEIESLREKVRKSELKIIRDTLSELQKNNADVSATVERLYLMIIVLLAATTISLLLWLINLKRRHRLKS